MLKCSHIYRVASLETEEEPGGEGSPVQVVVGAAPAVAGEDAEHQVGAAGQDEDDDLGVGEDQLVPENRLLHSQV